MCENLEWIIGEGDRIGGIIGVSNPKVEITNCSNMGDVTNNKTGTSNTGGIIGLILDNDDKASTIKLCYNSGNINGQENVGGIAGRVYGNKNLTTITKCYSKGKIKGTTNIGAIIGARLEEKNNFNILENLYYLNTVGIKSITIENKKPPIDIEEKNIKSTTDDITSYEQFIEWIKEK